MNLSTHPPVGSACFAPLLARLGARFFGSPDLRFDRAVKNKNAAAAEILIAEAASDSPIFTLERRNALACGGLHRLLLPFDAKTGFSIAFDAGSRGAGTDPLHGFLWRCRGEPDADSQFLAYLSACDFELFESALPPGCEGAFGLVVRLAHYGDLSCPAALRMLSALLEPLRRARAPRQLASAWSSVGRSALDADRSGRLESALPFLTEAAALLAEFNASSPATFAALPERDLAAFVLYGSNAAMPDLSWSLALLARAGRLAAVDALASASARHDIARGAIKSALARFPESLASSAPEAAEAAKDFLSWPEAFIARDEESEILEALPAPASIRPRAGTARL